jgi:putative flavoprotein involved in K+ transport
MSMERFETVIIGGGQAGLAMGYHLARRQREFVILDAAEQVGDSWRNRWNSLRLFTPARYDALPGTPFPAPGWSFPTRDEFADYLRDYAAHWRLPVRNGTKVHRLSHDGERYVVETAGSRVEADNVVIAAGFDRLPKLPDFADHLDPGIRQLASSEYHDPSQLPGGDVLIVGAGNSGADIALDLAATHRILLSGRHPGELPWHIDRRPARLLTPLMFFAFSHILTIGTPAGRKMRPRVLAHSGPLVRIKSRDLAAAGVQRAPRTVGVRDGRPLLDDGRTAEVTTVIWCTGFRPDVSWIDLPVFDESGEPTQRRGVVDARPGLYFLGGLFQYALASSMIHGVGRDAAHVADHLSARAQQTSTGKARSARRFDVTTGGSGAGN